MCRPRLRSEAYAASADSADPYASTATCAPLDEGSAFRGIGRGLRTQLFGRRPCRRERVHTDDPGAKRNADLDRGEPQAPTAAHQQGLLGCQSALDDHGAVRSGEATAKRRGFREPQRVREPDQIRLGVRDHDPLGERAPSGEPRLFLAIADLVVTCPTLCTRSARVDERGRHAIADRPSGDIDADLVDNTCELMTGHVWQRDRFVSHPGVPVTAAETGGPDGDDDTVAGTWRLRKLSDLWPFSDPPINDSSHDCSQRPAASWARADHHASSSASPTAFSQPIVAAIARRHRPSCRSHQGPVTTPAPSSA